MTENRPAIPADIEREVLVEAGHRCAIPTCKHPRVEIAHIVPWSKCRTHEFSNLIALCPNCHDLYDKDRRIDRAALRQYKANLAALNSRYIDVERRILEYFALHPRESNLHLSGGMELLVMYLLRDGLLVAGEAHVASTATPSSPFTWQTVQGIEYQLTGKGRDFVNRMTAGATLD